jgi:hypothetical protein
MSGFRMAAARKASTRPPADFARAGRVAFSWLSALTGVACLLAVSAALVVLGADASTDKAAALAFCGVPLLWIGVAVLIKK